MNRPTLHLALWTLGIGLALTTGCGGDEPKKQLSDGCVQNSDCEGSLVCSFGHCHQQCEATKDCPSGARCVKVAEDDNVCQLPTEEACEYNSDCAEPLVCALDRECRNQCQKDRDCVSGQVCTTSKVCAEPSEVDSHNNLVGGAGGGGGAGGDGDEPGGSGPDGSGNSGRRTPEAAAGSSAQSGAGGGGAPSHVEAGGAAEGGVEGGGDGSGGLAGPPGAGASGELAAGAGGAAEGGAATAGGTSAAAKDDGYFVSGQWQGYAWNAIGPTEGSTMTPVDSEDFSDHVADTPFCILGSIGAADGVSGYAMVGFDINTAAGSTNAAPKGTWTPASVSTGGVLLDVTNHLGSELWVQIAYDPEHDGESEDERWCATLATFDHEVLIPWSAFTTRCWTSGGSPYAGQALTDVGVVAGASSATQPTPFDFCVNSLGVEGTGTRTGGAAGNEGGAGGASGAGGTEFGGASGAGGTEFGGAAPGAGGTIVSSGGGTGTTGGTASGGALATGGAASGSGGVTASGGAAGMAGASGSGGTGQGGTAAGGYAGSAGSSNDPWSITFEETFEDGIGLWYADNGVWQVGTPSAGPPSCHEGQFCAGTVLDGDYPAYTDSRLISPGVTLPSLAAGEEIELRFWNWFSFGTNSSGQVQVSVWDPDASSWSTWTSIGAAVNTRSGVWSRKAVDLTAYAGQRVRLAFLHNSDYYSGAGWYVDSVQIVQLSPAFTGDFETGWDDWYAENGVWEVGTPTAGPSSCYQGESCVGTVMDGNYPTYTDSRLVSPTLVLPALAGGEELQLRFWNWFSFGSSSSGQVQVSVWDPDGSSWSAWTSIDVAVNTRSGAWSPKAVDLTSYAGQRVRIAFLHNSDYYDGTGWYIDAVQLIRFTPDFGGDFESGWGQWFADNGVWEVGTPTTGPASCYQGTQCAGTVLGGNYPTYTDSRLITPSVELPDVASGEELQLRFWNWFSFGSSSSGQVQISTWDSVSSTWSAWEAVGEAVSGSSPTWSLKAVSLTAHAGKLARIAFRHNSDYYDGTGWFIDGLSLVRL
jgi:hypothetical protein